MSEHRPSPGDLIGAVIEYLATTVRPALSGHARFESLISIRLLQIAAADYELGPQMRAREQQRLELLLGHGGEQQELEAELAGLVRSGRFDDGPQRTALLEALRASARDQLEIANPAYLHS